jgi:predicted Zn-dependent protease with MMP-like domain
MVATFCNLFHCQIDDIEELFGKENNIEVADMVERFVDEKGVIPNWNGIYEEALYDFAEKHNLEVGTDVDIYANYSLDTNIYVRKGLDKDLVEEMETLFGMDAEEMVI